MIEGLQSFYRRYLKRYWLGRLARNIFLSVYLRVLPMRYRVRPIVDLLGIPTLFDALGFPKIFRGKVVRFRLSALDNAPKEALLWKRSIHTGESVRIPGPAAWSFDGRTSPIAEDLAYSYDLPEIALHALRDATVQGRSDFVFAHGRALHHSLLNPSEHALSEELHMRGGISPWRKHYYLVDHEGRVLEVNTAIHLTGTCAFNYAHWLTEMLPRLLLADTLRECAALPVLVDAKLHPNLIESIAALAPSHTELIALQPGQLAHVKQLYCLDSPSFVPFDFRRRPFGKRPKVTRRQDAVCFSPHALRLVRERAHALFPDPASPSRRLLLRRRSGTRMIVNYDAIEAALISEGFEAVEPDRLSFRAQVDLFRHASVVVAQTGAGLANLLFAPRGCRALVLIGESPYAYYQYFSNLAHLVGVDLCHLTGPVVEHAAWHPTHANFVVDAGRVVGAVRSLGA